ncbi:MAG: family 43 glycosylhydrolase, partial [Clostridia bacterium]|nr:family 43 glycosylhydrolase [Clostridia bacterium]
YYATNDYAICVATADHPLGPWKKSVNNPVLSCRADLFGAGHNAFFTGNDGALYTSFHIQTHPEKPSGDRRAVIGKVTFAEKNGDILQTIE